MSGLPEILRALTGALVWVSVLLSFGAAIAAFAKLKVTPSGLLLGLGLGGVGCATLTSKIYHLAVVRPALDGGADAYAADDVIRTAQMLSGCTNLFDGLFWVLVAVGLALLPSSLRRLADRDADRPAQF